MDELVQFLRARLDEDERTARAAAAEVDDQWYYDDGFVLARREDDMVATGSQDFLEQERGEHIAVHDPARVLREIDAKRRLLVLYVEHKRLDRETFEVEGEHARSLVSLRAAYLDGVRHHAAVYADHPDYRDEWRP